VRPILVRHDVLFKVPARLEILALLNSGVSQFSQVGKFLTIYPRSLTQTTVLARELHLATRGLRGPEIPFDARYRKKSLVYYRYGAFRDNPQGKDRPAMVFDPAGNSHPDRRAAGHAVPRWLDDPFQRAGAGSRPAHGMGPVGGDYLPFKVITQRGKGGVYEAIDLSVSPARLVILKEGRRQGEISWDGEDGYARVRREGRVLRELRAAGVPVPDVFHEFSQDGNRYLVLEKIAGRPLLPPNRPQPAKTSWRRAQKILEQLGACLSRVHAAGWVWRDCKPWHIFLYRGEMRLIDLEGACRTRERRVLPWGSIRYAPPASGEKFYRRAGTMEDDYALGVIAFQLATGQFPPSSLRRRASLFDRVGCPKFLQVKINDLLERQF
jgi:Protein kinase domain